MSRNIVLIGGPDSGKTNYIGRLGMALLDGGGVLSSDTPEEMKYVEDAIAHIHQGGFAPRTDTNLDATRGSLTFPIKIPGDQSGLASSVTVPDMSGELWKKAVETLELEPQWMEQLEAATGALVFVRVLSDLNVNPPNWVTVAALMGYQGAAADASEIPTQVMLFELLRFLDLKLPPVTDGRKCRISIVITAWDLLHPIASAAGPRAYLGAQYPLFLGRIDDLDRFEIRVFGVSILGGDPEADQIFREELLDGDFKNVGYVKYDREGTVINSQDLTLPVAWALGTTSSI